jgi:hypothetical protein
MIPDLKSRTRAIMYDPVILGVIYFVTFMKLLPHMPMILNSYRNVTGCQYALYKVCETYGPPKDFLCPVSENLVQNLNNKVDIFKYILSKFEQTHKMLLKPHFKS